MDRVELIIQLINDKEAVASLLDLKHRCDALNNTKIALKIEQAAIDRAIRDLEKQLADLEKQRKIAFDASGVTKLDNDIAAVQRRIRTLENRIAVSFNDKDVARMQGEIEKLQERLEDLKKQREVALGSERIKEVNAEIDKVQGKIAELEGRAAEVRFEAKEQGIDQALSKIEKGIDRVKEKASDLGSVFSSVGSAFEKIGGIFTNNSFIDTLERYATVMGARMFTQDWGAATQRFDILNTYADYLNMVGVSAEEAAASLDTINANIQGIPVGLSDVAYQVRMYQMYMNDLDAATSLAIGLNRALIAGGANEQMRRTAMYEVDRLLSAGQLNTARQWRALLQGLGVSARFLREEMGYAAMSNNEFANALYEGEISAQEFLEGLQRLATSDSLNRAIEIYRTTIESGLSNIQFALTRGKANILSALNATLGEATGSNISDWLYRIRDAINQVYQAIDRWIRSNPDAIARAVSRLMDIFDRVKAFDWGSLAGSIFKALDDYLSILMKFYDMVPPGILEWFITFSMVWATPIGKALGTVGKSLSSLAWTLDLLSRHKDIPVISWLMKNAGTVGLAAGAVGLLAGGIVSVYSDIRKAQEEAEKIAHTDIVSQIAKNANALRDQLTQANNDYKTELSNIENNANRAKQLAEEILATNELIKKGGASEDVIAAQKRAVQEINALYPDLEVSLNSYTNTLDENSEAALRNADAIIEAMNRVARYAAAQDALTEQMRIKLNAQQALKAAKQEFNALTTELEDLLQGRDIQANLLKGMSWQEALAASKDYSLENAIAIGNILDRLKELRASIKEYEGVISGADSSLAEINNLIAALEKIAPAVSEGSGEALGELDSWETKLKSLITTYEDLRKAAKDSLDAQVKGFEEIGEIEPFDIDKAIQNLQGQATAYEQQMANIDAILKNAYWLDSEMYEPIQALLGQGEGAVAWLAQTLESRDLTQLENMKEAYYGAADGADALAEAQAGLDLVFGQEDVGGFRDAYRGLMDYSDRFNERWNELRDSILTGIGAMSETMETFNMEDIVPQDIWEQVLADTLTFTPEYLEQISAQLDTEALAHQMAIALMNIPIDDVVKAAREKNVSEDVVAEILLRPIENAIENFDPELENAELAAEQITRAVTDVYDQVNEQLAELTPEEGEALTIGKLMSVDEESANETIDAITRIAEEVMSKFGELAEGMSDEEGFLFLMATINEQMTLMSEETVPLLGEGITYLMETVMAYVEEGLIPQTENTDLATQATDLLTAAIEKLGQTIQAKIPVIQQFIQVLRELKQALDDATQSAYALKAAIEAIPEEKHVYVYYHEITVEGYAGGGVVRPVYRAIGGDIPWARPVGTDTVPAMLTPGEYVMRKKAVDKLGFPFLNMLNRLDISGAVDALMSRVNMPSGYVSYNNSRTYDNHATVNQKIYTNNPTYTYRRASRWARAL